MARNVARAHGHAAIAGEGFLIHHGNGIGFHQTEVFLSFAMLGQGFVGRELGTAFANNGTIGIKDEVAAKESREAEKLRLHGGTKQHPFVIGEGYMVFFVQDGLLAYPIIIILPLTDVQRRFVMRIGMGVYHKAKGDELIRIRLSDHDEDRVVAHNIFQENAFYGSCSGQQVIAKAVREMFATDVAKGLHDNDAEHDIGCDLGNIFLGKEDLDTTVGEGLGVKIAKRLGDAFQAERRIHFQGNEIAEKGFDENGNVMGSHFFAVFFILV